ncbi:MAG: endonuclease/exonuclease/phosphatase family protein [Myxococcota bacterium]
MLLLTLLAQAEAHCPDAPALRDPDGEVVVLSQNLKFIATGAHRAERAALLARYLAGEGAAVDLLLLSEARITDELRMWSADWCFYTQDGDGVREPYHWHVLSDDHPPAGLALGVRQRPWGVERAVAGHAGRRFRARPVSLAEGFLGRLVGYHKGWAGLVVDDTQIVWSHTQASYHRRPARGAGEARRGRRGQFEDLAQDLGRPDRATLLTGDLNLLAGFRPERDEDDAYVRDARAVDDRTVGWFRELTDIDLDWFKAREGTFRGSVRKDKDHPFWDRDAPYDRVGVNAAFLRRHPGTKVRPVEIADDVLRVSDHVGLVITIPYDAGR